MNPIEELIKEHEGVLLSLKILEQMALRIENSGKISDPASLNSLLEFFSVFVDKCHHGKEEDLLFPELERVGVSRSGGPIGVMLHEHQEGRNHIAGMKAELMRGSRGEPGSAQRFTSHARAYIALLHQHIEKENQVLYPMARQYLSDEKQEQLEQGFEKIETERIGKGKHQEFHRLLESLKRVYLDQ